MLNFIIYATLAVSIPCWAAHASSPGEVYPKKVEEHIGASVNITCTMNPKYFHGLNSSNLIFVNVNANENVSKDYIHVVNATSIVFVMNNASEQKTTYRCKCGTYAIEDLKVYIGTPPRNVSDFNCSSYDLAYMTCNFTQPKNSIYTKYTLTFNTGSEMYYGFPCNYDSVPLVVCNNTISVHNWVEISNFKLVANNALGNNTELFHINNYEVLIPSQPGKDFHENRKTTNSFEASWNIPNWNYYPSGKLQWEVLVQPENLPPLPLNISSKAIKRKNTLTYLYLDSLPYAFYWYELRLRSKLSTTKQLWSDYFVHRFRTLGKNPSRPPRTDVGSFYVGSQETQVRLYWEQLEEYEYNGENFTYVISNIQKDGSSIQLTPIQFEMNSAVFEFQKNSHYKFEIRSRNHIGESQNASYIEIYPLTLENPKNYTPSSIHNVYHHSDRIYTLTWQAPAETKSLVNYTVYWCQAKRALQNECNSSLHFQHVDKNTHNFTTAPQPAHKELILAVSANYINYNTGMHWPPCTVDVNIDLAKMEPEVQATSATTIKVQWSSENICLSVLEGYNLTYCEMLNEQIVNCWSKIIEKDVKKLEISSLRPYTQYKIEMYMYSSMKEGKVSEPLFVRTHESAPSPPRLLRVWDVRNTSAVISWLPPSQTNGIIQSYIVKLSNTKITVPANETTITLSNLVSFTPYKVFVIANTKYPSDNSNDVHFTTLIGYPSAPGTGPIRDTYNKTVIQWKRPTEPAGRIEYYEVAVTETRNDQIMHRRISTVVGDTSCALKVPRCIDNEYKTTIAVRAVNAAELPSEVSTNDINDVPSHGNADSMYYEDNDELICSGGKMVGNGLYQNASKYRLYKSEWQHAPTTFSCSKDRISKITVIALIVVLSSMAVMLAVYLGRRKYYKMSNIHCTLPSGLDMYITKDSSGGGDGASSQAQAREEEEARAREKNIWHYNNEKHHLLDSSGSDSGGFSSRFTAADASTICDNASANKGINRKSLTECMDNAEITPTDFKVSNVSKAGYATMKPDESLATPYSLLAKVNNNGGNYIKPLQIDWQLQTKDQQQKIEMLTLPLTTLKPINGYTPFYEEQEPALQRTSPVESMGISTPGGYVKPSALTTTTSIPHETVPKINLGGYTTLEQLGRIAPPISELPITNASGYTTLEQMGKQVVAPVSTLPQSNSSGYTTLEQLGKALPRTNGSGYTTLDQLEKTTPHASTTLPQVNSSVYTTLEQLTKKDSPASVSPTLEHLGTESSPVSSELRLTNASGYTSVEQLGKNVSQPPSTLPQIKSSGYTTLEQMGKNASQVVSSALPLTNASGYTTLEQLGKNVAQPPSTLPQIKSSGYMTLEQMGKNTPPAFSSVLPAANLNGYTTLGELGINASNAVHDEPRTGISGYVTQRELTAFGQKRN